MKDEESHVGDNGWTLHPSSLGVLCRSPTDAKLGQLLMQSAMEVILSKEARTTMSKLRPGDRARIQDPSV